MSCLALPRIHFKGNFVTNVCTANNNDVMLDVDYVNEGTVAVDTGGRTDADFRSWLQGFDTTKNAIRGGWNCFGDNSCNFDSALITAVELPDGTVLTAATDDPLIGATVHLGPQLRRNTAVMVDVSPEGTYGTQIFSDEMRVQKGATTLWKGAPSMIYSRWIDFRRNLGAGSFTGASAVWQAGIPLSALTFGAGASRGMDALRQSGTQGMLIRFCTYLIAPRISETDLAAQFTAGNKTINPGFGVVIGTIGGWESADELATMPLGRRLDPASQLSLDHTQFTLGPAVARFDPARHVISVDLVTAFPEKDTSLTKVSLGPASLGVLVPGEATARVIGPVPYDQTTYESAAGIVDVPITPDLEAHLEGGTLVVQLDKTGMAVLRENPFTIETDERGIYLQEGEDTAIELRVLQGGAPLTHTQAVPIEQYVRTDGMGGPGPATGGDQVVGLPSSIDTDASGHGQLTIHGKKAGLCLIRFLAPNSPVGGFHGPLDFFTNVRVLPRDDFSTVPDHDLTFAFVYKNVLQYYYLIYPTMDRFIDLSSEQNVRDNADALRARIAKDRLRHWDYMPRTRELSDGKRALLERWLSLDPG